MRHPVPLVDRRLRYAVAAGVAVVVFVASVVDPSSTGLPATLFETGVDKTFHLLGYAALAGAVGYARLDETGLDGRTLLAVFLLVTAYGVGIEFVQAPLSERTFDLADAAADAVGAVVGTAPYLRLRGR